MIMDDLDLPWFDEEDPLWDGEPEDDPELGGIHRVRPDPPDIRLAKEVLEDKGRVVMDLVGGDIWKVRRRKGDVRLGFIDTGAKVFKPDFGAKLTASELDEICSFLEEL